MGTINDFPAIDHLPLAEQLHVRLMEERRMHDETAVQLKGVEAENAVLRQLVKDLLDWTAEGFLLLSDAQKTSWEQKYQILQRDATDLLGEQAL